jgi:hypothetical protein
MKASLLGGTFIPRRKQGVSIHTVLSMREGGDTLGA